MTIQYQGVWSLQSAAQLQSTQRWVTDPLFENTTLLLQADDAANGAQNNTFLDSSSNSFAITRNPASGPNAPTQGSFTPFSSQPGAWSNYFNSSTSDFLNFTAATIGTNSFTIEAWIYLNSNSNFSGIFSSLPQATGTGVLLGFLNTGVLLGSIGNGGASTNLIGAAAVPTNTWHHVAFVRNGSATALYLNGASIATGTSSANITQTSSMIGRYYNDLANYYLNGYISNLRVVNGTAVYTANFTPPTAPLTAITNTMLLTCQSNRFVDNSASPYTLTVNGTPSVQAFSPFAPQFQWTPSVIGGSGYFDGTTDYLSVADNTALDMGSSDFTIEFWTYLVGTPSTYQAYFAKRANTATYGGVELYLTSGRTLNLQATLNGSSWGVNITTTSTVPFNTWTHIAAVRNGNTWVVYVNGTAGATSGTVSGTVPDNANTFVIGAGASDGSHVMVASYISNFRVVKGTAVYTGAFTPPIAPVTTSGPASSYSSTTNVNTTFTSTNTSLLCNFTNASIYDGTMKNNLETVGNAQINTSIVKYGSGSMFFDGTGDWLLIPHSVDQFLSTGQFTIELWVYRNASAAYGLVAKGTGTTGWLVSLNSSNQVVFTFTTSTITSSGAVAASTWTHIAVVREATGTNQTKIYINGVNDGQGTVATDFNQTNAMYVGADRTGGSAFNGYIDDLRITKGIARYTQNFIPPSVALPRQ